MASTKKDYNGKMQKLNKGMGDTGGGVYGGGKSTDSVGQGTGHGQYSKQMNPSSGNQQTTAGRKDPGQRSGYMKPKYPGIRRQGPNTLGDMV